jgi:hypothetical protein
MRSLLNVTLLFVVVLTGCGPTLTSTLPTGGTLPKSVAVLPADYAVDIPRERVDAIHAAAVNALRNQDFLVVEAPVVREICSSPQCPELDTIAQRYLVDGFISLQIASLSQNNFLAGYYDALSGELRFNDRSGRELARVHHTERSRGGLIFESGQILQGILAQVKRTTDSGFDTLAAKFATRLVGALPPPTRGNRPAQREGTEVAIAGSSAAWSAAQTYRVCVRGTPLSFASLLLDSRRTALREVTPGEYCGNFSALITPARESASVELRTAFGNTVRRDITLPLDPPCTPQERLSLTPATATTAPEITVRCAKVGSDRSQEQSGCSQTVPYCVASKVTLYTADSESGPFTKAGDLTRAHGEIPPARAVVQAVFIGAGGIPSQPAALTVR